MAGETMSISDLLGLNSPRGLLGNSFGNNWNGLYSPPTPTTSNFQVSHLFTRFIVEL